uniref:NADH-ubiquinone oxidoreductase chain 5 n=1 Tax=Ornithodoros zumpti TaxID=1827026 RepID=A0A1P8AGE6_9ACAR|nr:NADH dehydrogenase subunit 5 [Ornithodoros zumpti]
MYLQWGILLSLFSCLFFLIGFGVIMGLKVLLIEYYLFMIGSFEVKLYFMFDWMSLLFVGVVMFISGMVLFYSDDYMGAGESGYFCYGVLLFVGSMVIMILSPNLVMILLGWDGLGLVSYCLVIFYQNSKSDSSGMITVLSNRVGDVMILLSMVILINSGSFDFFVLDFVYMIFGVLVIVAGMTKSAQIPFSAWLPAAMAAPTPVSSLVHSSTLVTAGVYLLIRLDFLFLVKELSNFLMYISLMTMIMAGLGAMMEMDLKKIIALSTLSQLGLMMLILSFGLGNLAFFHLLTHALFKAMLFLCAGFLIHSSLGGQDIRFMGVFFKMNPLISVAFSMANMSLFGVAFLSGFYSKDTILEFIYMSSENWCVIYLLVGSTVSTCLYSMRVMYYSLWKGMVWPANYNYWWSYKMEVPIFFMGVFVLGFGSMLSWIIFPNLDIIYVPWNGKLLNMWMVFFGCWSIYVFYSGKLDFFKMKGLDNFLGGMWFLSSMTGSTSLKCLSLGQLLSKGDSGWLEETGGQGIYLMSMSFSQLVQWIQMSGFSNYLGFSLVILLVLI